MATGKLILLLCFTLLLLIPKHASAFGAGNIASIARIEGQNWRHGDIEDMLKTVAHLKGHKWTSMMIKRVYFGNWLRDYSQAVDVGTLKGVQVGAIRILVWVLAFVSFGYATAEFEVTDERLGVYRPEEHIDNPKDYADNVDARTYDSRLRPPVSPKELLVDPNTGMKNYIANEQGGWATSLGYVKYSFTRSIHFGRVYTNGARGTKGKEADLCEALRCLGQGLHCLEDFGAHTNYVELVLRELGFHNVFTYTGSASQIDLGGKQVFPLVTGTFGGVDFLHSVIGEATDHVSQSEIDVLDKALRDASRPTERGFGASNQGLNGLNQLLSKVPGTSDLCQEATNLQMASDAQAEQNARDAGVPQTSTVLGQSQYGVPVAPVFPPPPTSSSIPPASSGQSFGQGIPGTAANFDAQATIAKIYPILAFRDKVVRAVSGIVSHIPGLEKLVDTISEKVTLFIMSILAPYIEPVIKMASQQLKVGSSAVIHSSVKQQYLPWTDAYCTDPTHSMLSKDHFSNTLNEPAGKVAASVLQYVVPRIIYAWEHPDVPVAQVLDDIARVFHHPAARDSSVDIQRIMFGVVERWVQSLPDKGRNLDVVLSSDSVRSGRNHKGGKNSHLPTQGVGITTFGPGGHNNAYPTSTPGGERIFNPGPSSQPPAALGPGLVQSAPAFDAPPPQYQSSLQPSTSSTPYGVNSGLQTAQGQQDAAASGTGAASNEPWTYPASYGQSYGAPHQGQQPSSSSEQGFFGQHGADSGGDQVGGAYGQQQTGHGYEQQGHSDFEQQAGNAYGGQGGNSYGQQAGNAYGQQAGNTYGQQSGGAYPQQSGAAYPQQDSGAYPQQSGGAYPQQSGGAYPQQSGGAYGQERGEAYPKQRGEAYPQQSGEAYPRQGGIGYGEQSGGSYGQEGGEGYGQHGYDQPRPGWGQGWGGGR